MMRQRYAARCRLSARVAYRGDLPSAIFICPDCGKSTEVFRRGGGDKESERLGIPLLGRIPLDPLVCDAGDTGLPLVLSHPETAAAEEFQKVSAAITGILSRSAGPTPINLIN